MFDLPGNYQNTFYSLLRGKKEKKSVKCYRKPFANQGWKLFIFITVPLPFNTGTGLNSTKVISNAEFACVWMVFIISLGSNIYSAHMSKPLIIYVPTFSAVRAKQGNLSWDFSPFIRNPYEWICNHLSMCTIRVVAISNCVSTLHGIKSDSLILFVWNMLLKCTFWYFY